MEEQIVVCHVPMQDIRNQLLKIFPAASNRPCFDGSAWRYSAVQTTRDEVRKGGKRIFNGLQIVTA